jgi:hypothetical protein
MRTSIEHFHERMVVSVSADTNTNNDELTPRSEVEVKRENRWITFPRVVFFVTCIALVMFLFFGAQSGRLLAKNMWLSWIWWLPLVMLVSVFAYMFFVRKVNLEYHPLRLAAFILTPLLFGAGLWLLIVSGWPDDWAVALLGNAVVGSKGLGLWMPVNFFLVYFAPVICFTGTIKALVRPKLLVIKVLVFLVLAVLTLMWSLGVSVITNSGW